MPHATAAVTGRGEGWRFAERDRPRRPCNSNDGLLQAGSEAMHKMQVCLNITYCLSYSGVASIRPLTTLGGGQGRWEQCRNAASMGQTMSAQTRPEEPTIGNRYHIPACTETFQATPRSRICDWDVRSKCWGRWEYGCHAGMICSSSTCMFAGGMANEKAAQ